MILLASTSMSRQRLLAAAGVAFEAVAPLVDETALRQQMTRAGLDPPAQALALAGAKACAVSQRFSDALVLGCDQMLSYDNGRTLDKPESLAVAAQHLRCLSGRTHALHSAAVFARAGQPVWQTLDTPQLTMRPLSAAFIAAYLAQVGDAVTSSVGAYHLEGLGAQLFEAVKGDYFSILGLPLLPVLDYLRGQGKLAP